MCSAVQLCKWFYLLNMSQDLLDCFIIPFPLPGLPISNQNRGILGSVAYPLAFLSRGREPSINFPSVSAAGKTAQPPPPTKLISEPIFVMPTVTKILFLPFNLSDRSLGENSVVLVISGANSTTQGLAEAVAELARQKVLQFFHHLLEQTSSLVLFVWTGSWLSCPIFFVPTFTFTCVHAFCV